MEKEVVTLKQHMTWDWIEEGLYFNRDNDLNKLTKEVLNEIGMTDETELTRYFQEDLSGVGAILLSTGYTVVTGEEVEKYYLDGHLVVTIVTSCRGGMYIIDARFADGRYWKATDDTREWAK